MTGKSTKKNLRPPQELRKKGPKTPCRGAGEKSRRKKGLTPQKRKTLDPINLAKRGEWRASRSRRKGNTKRSLKGLSTADKKVGVL